MKSPYIGIDDAFAPMFTEQAQFSTKTGYTGTMECCVFPIETVDPFAETDISTDVKRANILVTKKDWGVLPEKPSIGDSITTIDGKNWNIEMVEDEQDWFRLEVRSA